jgi:hypothetical protein
MQVDIFDLNKTYQTMLLNQWVGKKRKKGKIRKIREIKESQTCSKDFRPLFLP